MIHNLSMLARAREQQIRFEVLARQEIPRPNRSRRTVLARLATRAVCRLGTILVTIGKRLECYAFRMLRESDYATG